MRIRLLVSAKLAALLLLASGCAIDVLKPDRLTLYGESLNRGGIERSCASHPDPLCEREAAWATCDGCESALGPLLVALHARVTACETNQTAAVPKDPGESESAHQVRATRECDGVRNRLYLIESFRREWQYKPEPSKSTQPFRHALALSGGGMRSASFAIGAMSGLQEHGSFDGDDRIDAISAVSGGSYAATWYLMQQFRCDERVEEAQRQATLAATTRASRVEEVRREVLDRCGPFEDHLTTHADVWPLWWIGVMGIVDALASPVNLFANGLFGWHANTTPAHVNYARELASRFNHVPPDVCPKAQHAGTSAGKIDFATLAEFVKRNRLPYLIVNAAAYVEDNMSHEGARLGSTVYEFALERSGSDGFGYFRAPDMSIRRAVAISGAAADSSLAAGSTPKLLFSALNHDLGLYVENPRFDPAMVRKACAGKRDQAAIDACEKHLGIAKPWWRWVLRWVLPVPFYLFDPLYKKDAEGARIYLSDGGHAENLGVFALVRRLPDEITIIDGEHDPTFEYEAYHLLKRQLRSEMGVELSVPNIDNPKEGKNQAKPTPYTNAYPIMNGKIGTFWIRDGEGLHPKEITLNYVKLSIDARNLGQYWGTWFKSYYEEEAACFGHPHLPPKPEKHPCTWSESQCPFPQEWTFDMEFSERQFRAYRDLGRWIVVEHFANRDPRDPDAEALRTP